MDVIALVGWDDTWEEVGGGAEGGLSLEVGLDEAAQRGAVARAERAGRGVGVVVNFSTRNVRGSW